MSDRNSERAPSQAVDPVTQTDSPSTESHLRSVLKALSWRIVATATTTIIAWLAIGEVRTALTIGGIEFFAKIPVYYFHERAWQMVPRGAVRQLLRSPKSRK